MNLKSKPFNLSDRQADWVMNTLKNMSMEEKIGQLFCLITYTTDENYLKYLSAELKIGGIMLRTMSREDIRQTINSLQKHADIPLLVSANLEAGLNQTCLEGTHVGCQMAIAATGDKKYARLLGEVVGKEASALGINWAFAPVIDIDYNFRNPITNTRTYGSDPETVAEMGVEYIKAVEALGVASSIKHFPGDGVDERDHHLLASVNDLSTEEWDSSYGMVYRRCIDAGAKTAMIGHIMLPEYSRKLNPALKDEEIAPGLIAPELLQGLLREKLGFNGLIITDSSAMAGMGTVASREKAVPLTIASGCDMFLFTKNLEEDFRFMTQGVSDGIITQERLDEAVTRILALKASLDLPEKALKGQVGYDEAASSRYLGCAEHRKIAAEVAEKSITLVKEEPGVLPVTPERYKRILVYSKENGKSATNPGAQKKAGERIISKLREAGFEAELFQNPGGWEGFASSAKEMETKYDLIIYVAKLATKSNQTTVRLEWEEPMGADVPVYMHSIPTIFVSLENPYHLLDVPRIKTYINSYGSTDIVLDKLMDKLRGKSPFLGKSPVDAFCGKWDTRL